MIPANYRFNRMRIQLTILAGLLLAAGTASAAGAGGDATKGAEVAKRCAACHGADGNTEVPTYPRLAGQYEDYLLTSLRGYADGSRANPIMKAQLNGLTDEDQRNVSAYFADQTGLKVVPVP